MYAVHAQWVERMRDSIGISIATIVPSSSVLHFYIQVVNWFIKQGEGLAQARRSPNFMSKYTMGKCASYMFSISQVGNTQARARSNISAIDELTRWSLSQATSPKFSALFLFSKERCTNAQLNGYCTNNVCNVCSMVAELNIRWSSPASNNPQ